MSGAETRYRSVGSREWSVEEHCCLVEAVPEGAVDGQEERMPE